MSTFNPCNQFLVNYLLKLRSQESFNPGRSYKSSNKMMDHQYHLYTKVIDSIRKYPLPLICEDQLNMLAGIGYTMVGKLIPVIKAWYGKWRKTDSEIAADKQQKNREKVEFIAEDPINTRVLSWAANSSAQSCQSQIVCSDQDLDQQNRDKMAPILGKAQSEHSKSMFSCSKSNKSNNSKQSQYKPRQGSQADLILKAMKILKAREKSISKKEIDKYLLENGNEKLKQWKNTKQTLTKNGFIEDDPSSEKELVFLTDKGLEFAAQKQQNKNFKLLKKKIESEIKIFKEKFDSEQKQKQQCSQSMSIASVSILPKFLPVSFNQNSLTLLIDTREMKDQSERNYFQEALTEKYKLNVVTQVLTLGDFVFSYEGQLLDIVIERKKADDLAASIIDGRYKEQKWRLKKCGATNIIYLYEGYPTESSCLKQKQLMSALHKTRVMDNFKIFKTDRASETVRLLSSLYSELLSSIRKGHSISSIGTLEEYNRRNTKNRYLTVQNVFGLGLKSLPNVGKQTVNSILRYFKSYYLLYTELLKFENNQQRIQFLNGLLKGGRTQAGVTQLIVNMLFSTLEQIRVHS